MEFSQLGHDEGVQRVAELLFDENLIPVIGSGFTMGCPSKSMAVPNSKQTTELMQKIIAETMSIDCSNADFNKTAERFFSIVPKERRWFLFQQYFTKVRIEGYRKDFLALPWPYIYTLNIDDGIENTQLYTPILPYHDTNPTSESTKLLYKLHGDAMYEVLYKVEKNIVFSSKQYIESLTAESNRSMLNAISSDYKQKNLLFIGCSLSNEPDLQYIYAHSQEDISQNIQRYILRSKDLSEEEKLDLKEYGINCAIIVRDYEVFYREVVDRFEKLKAKKTVNAYPFTNPEQIYLGIDDQEQNLKYFSGENIFSESQNKFYRTNFHIIRSCIQEIEAQLETHSNVIIRGRRFSGKTFVLSTLAERFRKYTVFYFPSEITIDEDVLANLLRNKTNSIFLFDSNSLTDYSYHQVANSEELVKRNHNKLVVAINSNDLYLADALHAETVQVAATFNIEELKRMQPVSDSFGLIRRKYRTTNIDYLKELSDQQKISFSLFGKMPKEFTKEETVLLILLTIKDKLYFSDINALDIRFRTVKQLCMRMQGIIEELPLGKGEKSPHSSKKLVHNSKYYLLSIMKSFSHTEIKEAILYIVSHLIRDPFKKRLYVETVLFDTLNQLFGYSTGAGRLIFEIYDALARYLSQDMDYWLQRAKSIYRLRPNKYEDLLKAYQYAKKALSDGNAHLKAKASLSTSLICCLLANLRNNTPEAESYEREAIVCADDAIDSTYFSINKGNLKGELRIGQRQSYSQCIREICDRQLSHTEDTEILWKANHVKKLLDNLETNL